VTGFAGGDTTFHYVRVLCYVATAALAAVMWSVIDMRRTGYCKLDYWLRAFLRYTLAVTMVAFASAKMIKVQFPDPSLTRLVQPLGEFEPTALMWAFIGTSTSYTWFSGAAELLGGLLLFFRRTTTLGALVALAVMLNVVAMNFSYDVPVKLLALHQVLICILLLGPDLGRLLNIFVLDRAVAPARTNRRLECGWLSNILRVTKAVVIGYAVFASFNMALRAHRNRAVKPPLYGIWQVEEFARNDETLPPLLTATSRWRQVIVRSRAPDGMAIKTMDDKITTYSAAYNRDRNTLTISPFLGEKRKDVFSVSTLEADHVVLEGRLGNDTLMVTLRRIDDSQFPLLRRGFHWISDTPWVPE
jgi:hypothetical protein